MQIGCIEKIHFLYVLEWILAKPLNFKDIYVCIGSVIRRYRERDYTQESFAHLMEYSTSYWGQVERGERRINMYVLEEVCVKLKVLPIKILEEAYKLKK